MYRMMDQISGLGDPEVDSRPVLHELSHSLVALPAIFFEIGCARLRASCFTRCNELAERGDGTRSRSRSKGAYQCPAFFSQ